VKALADTRADAFKASIEAGDVVIEFGRVTEPASISAAGAVAVSERIVLPLETARRLHLSLGEAIKSHAAALRAAEAQALPPEHAAAAVRPAAPAARATPDATGERAALLLRLVGELGVPFQHERSFRIAQDALLANRFLLTVDRRGIAGDARARVLDIGERLEMPQALRAEAATRFDMANCVHFGFEGDAGRVVVKLYLERAVSEEEARLARERGEPALLHLAFKWEPDSGAQVITEYLWHPALTAGEIAARLAQHVYRGADEASRQIAQAVLELAATRVAAERLQYLEVQEPGNGRRSFDLNLYNARLQVKDVQAQLYRMRERYGVRPGQFQALYDQIKTKVLGHLAGGVHRDGQDFFNLYYGVGSFPQFHGAFRRAR
jgi:tryptophan halogenase